MPYTIIVEMGGIIDDHYTSLTVTSFIMETLIDFPKLLDGGDVFWLSPNLSHLDFAHLQCSVI